MDQMKIGSFLKKLRKERNLTQEQFAEQMNVSSRTVSRWETGTNMPDISLLKDIASFYGISITEIIDGERKNGKMNDEINTAVSKVSDYAEAEKESVIKNIRNQSLYGAGALAVLFVLQILMPDTQNSAVSAVKVFCEALTAVSVIMVTLISTGLLSSKKRRNKVNSIPKPVLFIISAAAAFAAAYVIKFLLSAFGG